MDLLKNAAHFTRLKKRSEIASTCNPQNLTRRNLRQTITPKFLTEIFGWVVRKDKLPKYRKYFADHCDHLMTLYYDRKMEESLRGLGNMLPEAVKTQYYQVVYGGTRGLGNLLQQAINNWSAYGWFFSNEGIDMMKRMFQSRKKSVRINAFIELFFNLLGIWFLSDFDEFFFRKQVFGFLPDIDEFFKGTSLENVWIRWVFYKLPTDQLIAALQNWVSKEFDVDEEELNISLVPNDRPSASPIRSSSRSPSIPILPVQSVAVSAVTPVRYTGTSSRKSSSRKSSSKSGKKSTSQSPRQSKSNAKGKTGKTGKKGKSPRKISSLTSSSWAGLIA